MHDTWHGILVNLISEESNVEWKRSFAQHTLNGLCIKIVHIYNQWNSTWVTLLWYLSFSLPMLFCNGFPVELSKFEANIDGEREKEVEHMSTFFLHLTQDLMSQIVAARKNSKLNELKQNDDVHVTCQHLRAIYTLLKLYLNFGYKQCFYSKKGIYITCSAKRMCLFKYKWVFFFALQQQYTDGGRLVQQCTDTGGGHIPVW